MTWFDFVYVNDSKYSGKCAKTDNDLGDIFIRVSNYFEWKRK